MKFNAKSASIFVALFMVIGGTVFFANESNAQGKTYNIRERGPAGGWIFYDKGNSDDGWRYLEAAPIDQSIGEEKWGCYGLSIPDAQGIKIGTGKSNTKAIVKSCGEANTAAKLCTAYRGGGKSDWFLPSMYELTLMYKELYLNGDESKSSFGYLYYWSSTEAGANTAVFQSFRGGGPGTMSKNTKYCVHAIRAFK